MGINKNFVVRNGLEVANTLIYADDTENRVGVNSGTPEYALDVIGDVAISGAIVSSAQTSGVTGQYIKSTGESWEWETLPKARESARYTLVASQTRVPATGSFGSFVLDETDYSLASVYVDGVKLTQGDYAINAGGGSITLFAAAFGGEEIEIIGHSVISVGAGNTGILGITVRKAGIESGTPGRIRTIDFVGLGVTLDGNTGLVTAYIDSGGLSDVSGDPDPNLGGYLDLSGYGIYGTGIVTATGFVGDGSELTGITTLIKAGSNVTITTFSGITTINASGGGGSGTGYFDNDQTNAGIHTTAAHVGLGTTNPRFQTEIGSVGAAGTQLWVNGDARITGILTVGSSSVTIDGINDEVRIGTSLTLTSDGAAQYTGIVTASGFDGDLVGQHRVYTAGVNDNNDYSLAILLDPTQGGHTYLRYDIGEKIQYNPSTGKLSNVGIISATGLDITGVSTFQSDVTFQSNISLGDNDIAYFGDGNDLQISHNGALSRIQETGNGGLELRANPSITLGKYSSGTMGVFNVDDSVDLYYNNDIKFATTGVGASVVGILSATTFMGNLTGNATGLTNGSYNLNTSGIITATTFVGDGSGLTGITAVGSGVEIRDNDSLIGVAATINFGSNLSVSGISNGICTITGTDTDTGILEVVEDTTPQLGGDLDLNGKNIFGTGDIDIVGNLNTGIASFTSGIVTTSISVASTVDINASGINAPSGIITATEFDGPATQVKLSLSTQQPKYLVFNTVSGTSNGTRLEANASLAYDVYSQTLSLFNISASGGISAVGIITAGTFNGSGSSITSLNASNLSSGTVPDARFPATLPSIDGSNLTNLSAPNLVGALPALDGSALIGVVGVGSGVALSNNGTPVGTANTIDFGANIAVSSLVGGIATISVSGTGGGGTGFFTNDQIKSGIHTTAAHVGLGTTNPRTPLQVENVYGVYTAHGNFSATAGVTTDGDASWTIATDDFKTAEYTLWFQYNENIQSQKVLVMNDGTTAYSQEYAIMFNNDLLVSVGATIDTGVCKLLWTPETGVTGIVTYRVVRETML